VQLAIQLNYVYNQILSVLTYTQLSQIFEKSPGYDLRYLLQGSEKFVDNILNMMDTDPSFIIGGVSLHDRGDVAGLVAGGDETVGVCVCVRPLGVGCTGT